MELNRDDYCDECWLIVISEHQEVPSNDADEKAPTVLSDHPQRVSVTEEAPSTVLSHIPTSGSVAEEAPSTVLSRIPTRVSGIGEFPGTVLGNAVRTSISNTSKKSGVSKNEGIHLLIYKEPLRTPSSVKRTQKSGTTLNDVKSSESGGTRPKSFYSKTSPRRKFSGDSGFTSQILSSTSQFLEGARPNDSDLCLECLVDEYHHVFNKNVLRNVSGSGTDTHACNMVPVPKRDHGRYLQVCSDPVCPRFKFWKVVDAGGAGWMVDTSYEENLPPLNDVNESSCFVTSSGLCSKEQLVELSQVGLSPRIMDEVRPEIEVSEWFCGQRYCTSRYGFKVSLLDSHNLMKCVYGECKTLVPPQSLEWRKVTYTFRDYDPGVRYVLFHHGGQGESFRGSDGEGKTHPGSKMAGASVIVKRPTML